VLIIEFLWYTVAGIGLYLLSDWILVRIERVRGGALPNRSLIFFAIIFILAIVTFEVIQRILAGQL